MVIIPDGHPGWGVLEGFLHAGFLIIAFTIAAVLLGLIVRFLLVATKAAQVYVDKNSSPDDPGAPPPAA